MRIPIEKLLTKIQAEFLAQEFEQIDAAIVSAQKLLCQFFGTDRSTLWQGTEKDPQTLLLTHLCALDEIPPVPDNIKANEFVPWFTGQLLQNKTVVVPDVDQLPPEAAIDRKNLQFYGGKSTLAIPFIAGVNPAIYGALSFTSTQEKISWGKDLISECELIAQVFSSAMARKNAYELLNAERLALIKAKEEAEKNELKFKTTLELLPVPTGVANQNGELIFFNKLFTDTYGHTIEDVRTIEDWYRVAYPDEIYRNFVKSDWEKTVQFTTGKEMASHPKEYHITCKNGEIKIVEITMLQTSNMTICIFVDMTEKRRREEEHKKSEEMFSTIANLSPDIISVISKEGNLLFNSQASSRIHGYANDELIGKNTIELIHPEDREYIISKLAELSSRPGSYENVQYRYQNKDGNYTWMEATALNELENPLLEGVIVISRDISQRKRMEDELKYALDVRDEFISIASHELKTPVTSLKLQLQMLSRQIKLRSAPAFDSEWLLKGMDISNNQVNRITGLIENLLDVSRINAGKLGLKIEDFNLSDVLEANIESLRGLFTDAKCPLNLNIERDVMVKMDKNRVEQIFENLISNAIKYAPGKLIEISLSKMEDRVKFSIKDHGAGIPEEKQKNIFDKFERATASKNISGLGLGLFITKQIVEAHNGTISLVSEKEKGATFILDLPRLMQKT